MGDALDHILKQQSREQTQPGSETQENDDAKLRLRKVREIQEEGWDLFLRVMGDGSVVVRAVAVRFLALLHVSCVFALKELIYSNLGDDCE